MKAWSLLVALAVAATAQTPVLESQKKAVAAYPDLANPSSELNKKFVLLVNAKKASDPAYLQRDNWPLELATQAAQSLGLAPAASAAAGWVDPLSRAAGQMTINGTVRQRTAEGLLIQTSMRGDSGLVWLTGYDAKEGTRVSVPAVKSGLYDYTTVGGAAKTLDSYRPVK